MKLSEKALKVKESSTLSITAKAKKMASEGADIAAFTAGEPDFDTPDHIKAAAVKAIQEGFTKYTPSSGIVELRQAICDKLKNENGLHYTPAQIVVSNGGKHSLSNAFFAILNEGDEVLIPSPYWLSYPEMVNIAGGVSVAVDTGVDNGYKLTVKALEASMTHKTKALILNSPNNPTGAVYTREELQAIADFVVEKDIFVISDEMYEKLVYGNVKHISIAALGDEIYKRTITINGFSKVYAMTGWRMGYAASTMEIAAVMGNIQSHMTSNPNSITQKACVAALTGDQQCVEDMRIQFEKRRDYICKRIQNISHITLLKPDGAFYLFLDVSALLGKTVKDKNLACAADVADVLIDEYSVVVVPCADFGYPHHLRLSYAISMEDIEKGMDRIEKFMKENF